VNVIVVSAGGTAVEAGTGGIGFFSVPASDTGGSIASTVEEAMLFAVAGFFSGAFGEIESKDDRYRSADDGSLLFFLVEEASRDFDRDDADGELALSDFIESRSTEAFGVDTVVVGATGEAW
jgi:hypothetical protein